MKRCRAAFAFAISLSAVAALSAFAQDGTRVIGPMVRVYAQIDSLTLKAHVFRAANTSHATRLPAIVIFHGGGWSIGEPEWAYGRARHFAAAGMIAVAAQYRLSNQSTITPLEAMADARAVMRWMRVHADSLGLDPDRIAAYGWSAGAHLAAATAIFDDREWEDSVSTAPNALILVSPAVDLENDKWPQRLLGSRAKAATISPVAHVRPGLPPTLIVQGRADTVTPLAGVQLFCDRMRAAGNRCDLHIYDGVGHLFTPANKRDDGWPQPDPQVQAAAFEKIDDFMAALGYLK